MKYKYEILALLGLIILLFIYFKYFHSNKENYNNADEKLRTMKETNYNDSKKYIKKQKKHFGARGMPTLDDEAYDDTVFLKVSEDATKTDYNTGEIGLQKDYSSFDQPKTDYQKAVQKCERINKLKMCSLLEDADENGYGCGYSHGCCCCSHGCCYCDYYYYYCGMTYYDDDGAVEPPTMIFYCSLP